MADSSAFDLPSFVPLEPVAAPVDTYATQPKVGRSNLEDLAASLSTMDAGLRDFMRERQATAAVEDTIRGQAAFYQGNKQGFADAVSSGAVPAQASPAFIAAYKKAQGTVAGVDLQAKFNAAYAQWDGKTSDDPQAYTKFATGFIQSQLANQQDPAVLKGLLPHVNSMLATGLEKYTQDRHKLIYTGSIDTHTAEAGQAITEANKAGLAAGTGTDYDALNKQILDARAKAVASGVNPQDLDPKLIAKVSAEAILARDPKIILGFLDQKVPGKDYTFGESSPEATLHKEQIIHKFEVMGRQALHDEASIQKEADKKAKAGVTAAAIEALSKDPSKPLDDALLAQGTRYDPEFRIHALTWQKHLAEGAAAGDPAQVLQVHREILDGKGIAAIQDGLTSGALKNPADLDKAFQLWKGVDAGGDKAQAVLKNQLATTFRAQITARTPIKGDLDSKLAGIGGMSDAGVQANVDFDTMLLQWTTAHPNATAIETNEFITKAGKSVLDGLGPAEFGKSSPYNRTTGATTTLQEGAAATAAPPATRPKQPIAPTTAPPPIPHAPDLQQWIDGNLTPEQKAIVEKDAAEKGVPVEDRMQVLYDALHKQPTAPNAAPATTPPAQPGSPPSGGSGSSAAPGGPAAAALQQGAGGGGGSTSTTSTTPPPSGFGMAFGDSIAAQQVRHGVPGTEGKMGAANPGMTAVVGDTPAKVLARMQGIPQDQFAGRTIFLSPGTSNDPKQVDLVNQQLDYLKQAGVANVAVPGVGPGVRDWPQVNARLEQMAKDHGYTYFLPQVKWMKDGIHPAEVDKLRGQAIDAVRANAQGQEADPSEQALTAIHNIVAQPQEAATQRALGDIEQAIRSASKVTTTANPTSGAFTLATIKDDPKAASILDFISGPESNGNYNAVIGNAHATQDLSKLTINEVYLLQRQLVNSGRPSSAIGRYQIIRSTLAGLVNRMGVDPRTTHFTPEIQDRLAVELLQSRGYDRWKAGKMSDQEFASNLSREWASLPDPFNGGRSHYEGDSAGNHAGKRLADVYNVLRG